MREERDLACSLAQSKRREKMKTALAVIVFYSLLLLVSNVSRAAEGGFFLVCDTLEQLERVVAKMEDLDEALAELKLINEEAGEMACGFASRIHPVSEIRKIVVGNREYLLIKVVIMVPVNPYMMVQVPQFSFVVRELTAT